MTFSRRSLRLPASRQSPESVGKPVSQQKVQTIRSVGYAIATHEIASNHAAGCVSSLPLRRYLLASFGAMF